MSTYNAPPAVRATQLTGSIDMIPKRLILAFLLLATSNGLAADKMIQPDDKSGDDIRAAAKQFLTDLADGKAKEARAECTGDGAKMLDRYITAISLGRELKDAANAKFPNNADFDQNMLSPDKAMRDSAQAIPGEVITVDDAGTHASITRASELVQGVELTRVDGKWKVSNLLSLHGKDEEIAAAVVDAMNAELPSLIARVKKGDFSSADAVMSAMDDAMFSSLRKMAATRPALKEGLPPDTQPAP
jgi:hypothetical protein